MPECLFDYAAEFCTHEYLFKYVDIVSNINYSLVLKPILLLRKHNNKSDDGEDWRRACKSKYLLPAVGKRSRDVGMGNQDLYAYI